MILQERNEIRLVVGTYDSNYIKYIEKKSSPFAGVSLLKMAEYGPWNIGSSDDMASLGPIILALTLQEGKFEI